MSSLTALLIEDDHVTQGATANMLAEVGFSVVVASTGSEGIDAMRKQEFDLCVVDLFLPDIEGHKLIEILAMGPNGSQAEIVAVTSSDNEQINTAALSAGATDVYQKTIGLGVLKAKFKRLADDFLAEKRVSCKLSQLENQLHEHATKMKQCADEKDVQIESMREILVTMADDIKEVKEVIGAWRQTKVFFSIIRGVGRFVKLTWPIWAFFAAFVTWLKTGVWTHDV